MQLLAFAASNSRSSINRTLVEYTLGLFRKEFGFDMDVEILDLNAYEMPIYSIDRERENGVPNRAKDFFQKIGDADAVIVSFAEHNGTTTAAWKNLFDWMSRIDTGVWQERPMMIMAATPGARAGAGVLQHQTSLAPHFGGRVTAAVGVGRWQDTFDNSTGALTNAEDIAAIHKAVAGFTEVLRQGQDQTGKSI